MIIEMLLCRVDYKRPVAWDDPNSAQGQWPHDDASRALAYTAGERDEITHELDAAKIAYKLLAEDQPDAELLTNLQGRVSSRSEALAALQAGKVPPNLDDIEHLRARVADLEAQIVAKAPETA